MGKTKKDKFVVVRESYLRALQTYANIIGDMTSMSALQLDISKHVFEDIAKAETAMSRVDDGSFDPMELLDDGENAVGKEFAKLQKTIENRDAEIAKLKAKLEAKSTPKSAKKSKATKKSSPTNGASEGPPEMSGL